jgi:hypothetical protein
MYFILIGKTSHSPSLNPGKRTMPAPEKKRSKIRTLFKVFLILAGILILLTIPGYFIAEHFVNRYFDKWGNTLNDLEDRGLLSKEFGAGWQDVLAGQSMETAAHRLTENVSAADSANRFRLVDGIMLGDYPSLSIIERLREIREYSNSIEIDDRNGRQLALIKTDHRRARINEFPPVLVHAVMAAEDPDFQNDRIGFQYKRFVRASLRAVWNSIKTMHPAPPRGTSTITQQVAKLFISKVDTTGRRHVSRSYDRKLRELRLAAALRKRYSGDDIMEVYLNHCVTSDYGLVGYKDIAAGLFNKDLKELSDAQCIYLSRMVKWGRNVRRKIIAQCRLDMPRMGKELGWDRRKQEKVLAQLDTLTFTRPKRVDATYGSLVDLANEFWLLALRHNGATEEQLAQMDLIDPNSLIRKKGNLKVTLTIDAPLQHALETLVNSRGYGPDTNIVTDIPVATLDSIIVRKAAPRDSIRVPRILREPMDYREPSSPVISSLNPGDSVTETIKYKKTGPDRYRRTVSIYYRKSVTVDGQYFSYAIMDSRTGALLAYYSKDRLGSRLACLLKNRTPNGSSTAKPILNALVFDLGVFQPYSRWSDSVDVSENVPWKRAAERKNRRPTGMIFAHSAVRGRGYTVHNHLGVMEGCQYIFDLLATSNNILAVESLYRLNHKLFDESGDMAPEALPLVQYFYRIGAFARIKDSLRMRQVTGVRVYKELARTVGVDLDSITASGKRIGTSDSLYSVALGTLELSLYEQMHMYNMLYNNDLIVRPADHPSLVLRSAVVNGDTLAIADTVKRVHPFLEVNNLRPTWLGMHKRLTSYRGDGLAAYDIPFAVDSATTADTADGKFHSEAFTLNDPPSNFAKSGTTDDVIKPFNHPGRTAARTNYGLWNAVIRLNLAAFASDTGREIKDITVACVGECNQKYTGARDGKTLHRYLTAKLLKVAGIKSPNGFFANYEKYLRKVTPAGENCGEKEAAPAKQTEIENKGD